MTIQLGTQINVNSGNSNYIREIRAVLYDINGEGIEFKGRTLNDKNNYDLSFNINKNDKKEPNESTITLYGLGEETRRKIENKIDSCFLYAGYKNNSKLIAMGDVSEIKFQKNGPEIITTISFQDGAKVYRQAEISKNVPAKTNVKSILETLLKSLVDVNNIGSYVNTVTDYSITENISNYEIETPMILDGNSFKILNEFCQSLGLICYIADGKVFVRKPDESIYDTNDYGSAILISSETGLVNSPEKVIRLKTNKKTENEDYDTQLQILLNPNITVGSGVRIRSKFINSFAIVKEINHSGSNFDTPYYTTIKAKLTEPIIAERESRTNNTQRGATGSWTESSDQLGDGSDMYGSIVLKNKYAITSNFGPRVNPVTGIESYHYGVDIATPYGTPIYAPFDALVTVSGPVSGYGTAIYLSHPDGTSTRYGHLSQVAVSKKTKIKKGDIIGYTGNTGISTGPHLHFELRDKDGTAVDPRQHGFWT